MVPIKECLEGFAVESNENSGDPRFTNIGLLKALILTMGGEDAFIENYRNHNGSTARMTKPTGFEKINICADFFIEYKEPILAQLDKMASRAGQHGVVNLFKRYFVRDLFTATQISKALHGEFGSDKKPINQIRAIAVFSVIDEIFRLFQHYAADHLFIEYPVS